jgi:histidinol-phosphate aminotransferase
MACLAHGVRPVEVPLGPDFELDVDAVAAEMQASRPNLAFFARPNNPTGTLWPRDTIAALARQFPDVVIVADEAYDDYCGDSMIADARDLPNLVVMRTLSKIGMAALRVGFLHGPEWLVAELEKVRTPYNLGSLNQRAAVWMLDSCRELIRDRCAEVVRERERVRAALAALPGVHVFDSRANLLLFRVGTPGDGQAAATWRGLADRGVLVRDLDRPGPLAGCLRVTIGTPEENDRFLDAMTAVSG